MKDLFINLHIFVLAIITVSLIISAVYYGTVFLFSLQDYQNYQTKVVACQIQMYENLRFNSSINEYECANYSQENKNTTIPNSTYVGEGEANRREVVDEAKLQKDCKYLCEKNNLIFDDTYLSNQCYSSSDIREYYQFKKDYDNKCYLEKTK